MFKSDNIWLHLVHISTECEGKIISFLLDFTLNVSAAPISTNLNLFCIFAFQTKPAKVTTYHNYDN